MLSFNLMDYGVCVTLGEDIIDFKKYPGNDMCNYDSSDILGVLHLLSKSLVQDVEGEIIPLVQFVLDNTVYLSTDESTESSKEWVILQWGLGRYPTLRIDLEVGGCDLLGVSATYTTSRGEDFVLHDVPLVQLFHYTMYSMIYPRFWKIQWMDGGVDYDDTDPVRERLVHRYMEYVLEMLDGGRHIELLMNGGALFYVPLIHHLSVAEFFDNVPGIITSQSTVVQAHLYYLAHLLYHFDCDPFIDIGAIQKQGIHYKFEDMGFY